MAKAKVSESVIVNHIIKWCFAHGLFAFRNNTGAYKTERGNYIRYGAVGSPDIIAVQCKTGKFIGIEAKSATGKQSPEQKAFQQKLEQCGALYILARGLDDLEARKQEILGALS